MKRNKKILAAGTATLVLTLCSIPVFAGNVSSPSETLAQLTGRTKDSVVAERQESGKCYGEIAKEEDKLEDFKKANLERKKTCLETCVENGTVTESEAEKCLSDMEARQKNCDGSGKYCNSTDQKKRRCGNGRRNGNGSGNGRGYGNCNR